jgi:hypothetical protein
MKTFLIVKREVKIDPDASGEKRYSLEANENSLGKIEFLCALCVFSFASFA